MTESETKLLNCPFCGGEAAMELGTEAWYVSCGCAAAPMVGERDRDDAIAAWNARPSGKVVFAAETTPVKHFHDKDDADNWCCEAYLSGARVDVWDFGAGKLQEGKRYVVRVIAVSR